MTAEWFLVALRHDRVVVLASLGSVVLLAWSYLLLGAGMQMEMMDMGGGQMMAMLPEWTPGYGLLVFVMWAVMMVAMMLPSAAPVTLLVASIARKRAATGGKRGRATPLFVLIEKVLPWGDWTGRATGLLMVAWGAATLATAI